nr:conotoxin precursor L [Conus ebraeus]
MKLLVTFIVVLMLATSLTYGFSLFSNNGERRAFEPRDPDAADQLVREERATRTCNPPCTGLAMCQSGTCGYVRFR